MPLPAVTQPWMRLAAVLLLILVGFIYATALPAQEQEPEPTFLLLEVRLDQSILSSAIPAYDVGEQTLLPMGELVRLLTIAIQTQPDKGSASGFILSEDRTFSLNLEEARVTLAGVTEAFDPALVLTQPDDLYVAKSLLERWLPIELEVDRSSLSLRVRPLETLPLQARLQREHLGDPGGINSGYQDPGYPHHELPYRLLSMPFIDQTFATELRKDADSTETDTRYTAFLTGDLLGMESSIYFSKSEQDSSPDVRATLGRHDPGGNLLGPLHASSFSFGSVSAPSVENITRGASGEGLTLSNRPLTRPTNFDRQTFEGDLPPGWDVELYYNGALIEFQRADAEGRYRFEDQPLSFGRNDFRLVFNGPLGQTRAEQHSFSLDQSMVKPGEFEYSFTEHRDDDGRSRSIAQFDLGLARALSASAGFIRAPVGTTEEQYTTLGLRTFWQSLSLSGDFVQAQSGGSLLGVGVQTRISGVAVDASRTQLNDFNSDVFFDYNDPIRSRDELRLSGSIPFGSISRLPVSLTTTRDVRESGMTDTDVSARISAYIYQTALTNTLSWHSFGEVEQAYGNLQASHRVRDMNLRGEVNYILGSESEISSLALSVDKYLADGYRLTFGVEHAFVSPQTRYIAGFSKSLGRYGLGVNASYLDTGEVAMGAQVFIAMGQDPRRSNWMFDARPMANSGAASARIFLDENNNGIMDHGEEPLPGAGFTVNGGRHQVRTDAAGIAHIDHLPVKQYVDIGVDTSTLIDPQWAPEIKGMRLAPRPGGVASLEFPVHMTTEIDGTVYLLEAGIGRGIGDLKLELLDEQHQVVAETTSSWDGFYIISGVIAGDYWLRVSPEQLQRLELTDTGMRSLTVLGDGTFVSGIDMLIRPLSKAEQTQSARRNVPDSPQSSESPSALRSEPWILQQSATNLTIQLMAASSEAAAQQYIVRHRLTHTAAYFRTQHRGAPWYTVVYGSFASDRQAQAALAQLPSILTQASPWLRHYAEIQDKLARPFTDKGA